MYVRVWDRMAKTLEWRLLVWIDAQWVMTDSLRGGILQRFNRTTGHCEHDEEIRLDREDLAKANNEYERRGGWLDNFSDV